MDNTEEILANVAHRQYPLPKTSWQHYQEWHDTIMLHWQVEAIDLKTYIPQGIDLDLFEGKAWVSLFAFSVRNLRTKVIPPVSFLSDFHEINLRTYVIKDGKPGIYFFSIEAEKLLPSVIANTIIGLPYKKSSIIRNGNHYYTNDNGQYLDITYEEDLPLIHKTYLDLWLTERHCLYDIKNGKLFRIDIHHKEWLLQQVRADIKQLEYPFCNGAPMLMHYAEKISVLVWAHQFL